MARLNLIKFVKLQRLITGFRLHLLVKFWKMDIHETAVLSLSCHLDKVHPTGIHIGEKSYITKGVIIMSHDSSRQILLDTYIGKNCFVGVNSIILPGIKIGDNVIVGAGSVVTKSFDDNLIIAGNPARVIKINE